MVAPLLYKCFVIVFIIKCCTADENLGWGENITKLYELISSAVKDDLNSPPKTRRVFVNDSLYQIHLNKLKDVNGLKMHNIVIKRSGPDINSTIYINNPLEAKLPHPFMSLEEFKKTLVEQQVKNREAFMKSKKKEEYSRIWAGIKATAKIKTTNNKPVTEKAQKSKVENELKSEITNTFMNITKAEQKTQEHANIIVKANSISSKTLSVKDRTTLTSKISSAINSRVKLLALEQNLPIEHRPPTNETHDNGKISNNVNVQNKQLNETVNTMLSDTIPKPIIVDETLVEKDLAASNAESSAMDDKSPKSIIQKITTTDEGLWTGVNEKELTNVDDEEASPTDDITTETSLSTTTTIPTTTTVKEKWSRPRVLLDEPDTASTASSLM